MSSDPQSFRSRLGAALTWTLMTIIRLIVVIALLFALAFLIQAGLNALTGRIDSLQSRVTRLDGDVGNLMEENASQRQQIRELERQVAGHDRRLDGLGDDLSRAGERLETLAAQVEEVAEEQTVLSEDVGDAAAGLTALQGDLNVNGQRIDELGGELDGLEEQLTQLDRETEGLADQVAEPVEALDRLEQSLALFRLWELVARARLRLIENNPGLALADTQQALVAAETLAVAEGAARLEGARLRLSLAADNLPADPAAAARDLDAAWEIVDALLNELVPVGIEVPAQAGPEDEGLGGEEEGSVEPTPTATPSP